MTYSKYAAALVAGLFAFVGAGLLTADEPVSSAQAQQLPQGDIVFVIDESGSMRQDIDDVRARVNDIANQLGSKIDFQLGLVGFGQRGDRFGSGHGPGGRGEPHIHTTLTPNISTFSNGLDELVANGGFEPGFRATSLAVSDEMNFREKAGACVITITDEDADPRQEPEHTDQKNQALNDLDARDAVWFGIVNKSWNTTPADYGPDAGSLSAETGGKVFSIQDFRQNPDPVLNAVIDSCAKNIVVPVPVDVKPTSCPNPLQCKGKGVIPVAINGTKDIDVTKIDPNSVTLAGVSAERWNIEDVSTPREPYTEKADCNDDCHTKGKDGRKDLTLKFDKQAVRQALEDQGVPTDVDKLCLTVDLKGKYKDKHGGIKIAGEDVVRFQCKGNKGGGKGKKGEKGGNGKKGKK